MRLFSIHIIAIVFCVSAFVAVRADEILGDARYKTLKTADYTIENSWVGQEKDLFGEDGSGRWRYFMHGVTDETATPINWTKAIPRRDRAVITHTGLRCDAKTSNVYTITLEGAHSFQIPAPLIVPSNLEDASGQILRFFIWMKGKDVGKKTSLLNGAPRVILTCKDAQERVVATATSLFKTRGTFPWFCYYIDLRVPPSMLQPGVSSDAAGIYLTLENPADGTVSFAAPSWRILTASDHSILNEALPVDFTDPQKGTFAPNPDYDEMSMNFFFGIPLAEDVRWNFLEGNLQQETITQVRELKNFLKAARADWFSMMYVIPYLTRVHVIGKEGHAPLFQQGWLEALSQELRAIQDAKTGLWKLQGYPNLILTQRILEGSFSPTSAPRTDTTTLQTPWRALGDDAAIPRVDTMAQAILAERQKDKKGVLAGWSKYAFQDAEIRKISRDAHAFELQTSIAALTILRLCEPQVDKATQEAIRETLQSAYIYAMKNLMSPTGILYSDEAHTAPATAAELASFLDATHALEPKQTNELPTPQVMLSKNANRAVVTLKQWPKEAMALRIYLANDAKDALNDAKLLTIVRSEASASLRNQGDPLANLRFLSESATAPKSSYLSAKLQMLADARTTVQTLRDNAVTLPLVSTTKGVFQLVFTDGYGNASAAATIPVASTR